MDLKKWVPWNWFKKEEKEKNYYRMERSYGAIQRVLSLPEDADQDGIEATFKKGVLTVTLPKSRYPNRVSGKSRLKVPDLRNYILGERPL